MSPDNGFERLANGHILGLGRRLVAQPDWLELYLQEDLADAGDVTSDSLFGSDDLGQASIVAREAGVVAGGSHAVEVFRRLGADAEQRMNDGSYAKAGDVLLTVRGPAASLLKGERLALNLMARMSGIATETRRLMEALADACCGAVVAGTRKTTPGFRVFEKEAIKIGGGEPHRMGLHDAAMIKDNHREAAGDIGAAVRRIHEAHPDIAITAEVETLDDALAAAAAGAHWLLIDNQTPATGKQWAQAVWNAHPGVKIEASGGITADNVTDYGWADRISMGSLTTAARGLDLSMEWAA